MSLGTAYLLLAVAIACEIVATSALKASLGLTRIGPAVLVVGGYGAAFLLLSRALQALPVGTAYAIWAGVGVIGVALVGAVAFEEAMTAKKLAGMALIVAGVALVKFEAG